MHSRLKTLNDFMQEVAAKVIKITELTDITLIVIIIKLIRSPED
jgi:hypothetical protein